MGSDTVHASNVTLCTLHINQSDISCSGVVVSKSTYSENTNLKEHSFKKNMFGDLISNKPENHGLYHSHIHLLHVEAHDMCKYMVSQTCVES